MTIELSKDLALPVDAVTQTFAFMGRRGSGKSYASMKLAEGMLDADAQIVALDPVGVWFSLRIAADGKGKGYDLPIFGGLHGDVPLEPGAGAFIADLIVDRGISAILDVSHFRKNDRKRFATDFAEQLFHRKKQRRSPVHLFVEEAQVFVPQRAMGDEARMLGAFEDIIKLGRNFGIGATLISQRPQAVNKDALNQTEALFVLQTNGAQERKALEAWIVEQGVTTKSIVDELPSLPIGTAYLWSPSWLRKLEKVQIGKRKTYNASATPVAGMERVEPRPLTPAELRDVETAMAATIERARADDPKALRARISELEKAARTGGDPDEVRTLRDRIAELEAREPERVEIPVLAPEVATTLLQAADRLTAVSDDLASIANVLRVRASTRPLPARPPQHLTLSKPAPTPRETPQRPAIASAAAGDLAGGPLKVLTALARCPNSSATRTQLGVLAGYSPSAGGFRNNLSALRQAGMIQENGGNVQLSALGANRTRGISAAVTTREVHELWRAKLDGGPRKVLDVLLDHFPRGLSREELAEIAGYVASAGGFRNNLSALRTTDLIEERDRLVFASKALFPTGPVR